MLKLLYDTVILPYAKIVLIASFAIIGFLGYQATKLTIDASAETLLLEDDKDLALTREINKRYASSNFLVIAYTPSEDLLAPSSLKTIQSLSDDLLAIKEIASVTSVLNVPLLQSPAKPVKELLENVPSLSSPSIDKQLARNEFLNSPIYRNNLVSSDFKTTALLVTFHDDTQYKFLRENRNSLRHQLRDNPYNKEFVERQLKQAEIEFKQYRDATRELTHNNIVQIRSIMDKYRNTGELFLGGTDMIADDLVTFIKDDLRIFGVGVLILLILALGIIFRQLRWVILPIITCSLSVVATAGLLGMFNWEVTVISSNFISLQLILTMAITIHLIVRYRELVVTKPDATQRELLLETVSFISKPCFYTVITTIAGFGSLMFSGILPVTNFGWMMSAGVTVSLIVTFLLFPTIMMQIPKLAPKQISSSFMLTSYFSRITEKFKISVPVISLVLLGTSIAGALFLKVENSFIDYFKPSTEIYQGLSLIDQKLGGTTPLDVVLSFNNDAVIVEITESNEDALEDDEFDDFEEEFSAIENQEQYWFTSDKMEIVEQVHDYLESQPAIGKVLSLATMLKVGRVLNDGKPLDGFLLALIYNKIPEEFRKIVLSPYLSIEDNQVRFNARIVDSLPDLRRNELIKEIQNDLANKLNLEQDKFSLSNMLILYNNMLQSLFESQILTLGAVIILLLAMFLVLFRSLTISVIALFPNVLSIAIVLGFMGWMAIPLDMMTITIAAISMGIAVDNTIHYIYRFRHEFAARKNYLASMHAAHDSIGHAMYYTSITIILGFSILVFSNFIPSIYFGLLTSLAMLIALTGALTLLPRLLMMIKPFGKEA